MPFIIFICVLLCVVGIISTFVSCYEKNEDVSLWINFSGIATIIVSVIIIVREAMK